MKLTSRNVENTFLACLSTYNDDHESKILIEGIVSGYQLNKYSVDKRKDDIYSMLLELPDDFQEGKGGGMSFLNACMNQSGEQWTDLQRTMEHLFVLGIACNKVEIQAPRELWSIFPGGMPYYCVINK